MKNASLKFGVFALSSQRINKLLLVLAGLTVLLFSMCYWAVERVLDEERVFQNHGLALSQSFILSERKRYDPVQLQGGYSLGVQLTDYYSAFWASSFYSAPQIFLFSPTDQFNIAIAGVDGMRKQSLLLKSNFFDVTAYLYQGLLTRHEQLNNRRVSWMRAPKGLLQGTETIVAFIGVDINPSVMPERRDDGLLTVAALLDAGQINDLDRLQARPMDHRVTLISPAGAVLLGVDGQRLRLKVLVAEDNPINRAILQEQLEALGAWVAAAEDGEEALQRWSPGAFDVVITDINMPRLDGYGLTRALREEGEQCLEAVMDAMALNPSAQGQPTDRST